MSTFKGMSLSGVVLRGRYATLPSSYASRKMGHEYTFNDPAKVLINSGKVETVYDLSGQGRHFTQTVAGSRPTFNLGSGATFLDQFLESTLSQISDTDGTLFMTLRFDRASTEEYLFSKGDGTAGDGNAYSWQKTSANLKRSILAVGLSAGIQGNIAVTDTTTFRVYCFQKKKIYQSTNEEDVTIVAAGGDEMWFNSPTGGTQRTCIGKRAGTINNYGRFTLMSDHYMNDVLPNTEVVKVINGLKIYHGL